MRSISEHFSAAQCFCAVCSVQCIVCSEIRTILTFQCSSAVFFVLPFVNAALVCTCIYQLLIIIAFIFPLFFIFFIFTVAITLYYFIVAIFPLLTIPYFLSPLPSFSSIGIINGQWFFHLFRKWDTIADVSINPWCNGEKKTKKVQFWKEEEEGLHFKLKVKLLWLTLSRKLEHALLCSCIYKCTRRRCRAIPWNMWYVQIVV